MIMPLFFEKPLGTKDILSEQLEKVERIVQESKRLLKLWGYAEVKSPIVEYYQTVGFASKSEEENLLKFFDGTGKTVVLRPDFTAPLARLVATNFNYTDDFPLRLMYQGKIYENLGDKGLNEINQIGIELMGLDDLQADAEVIALAIKIIKNTTDKKFKISIGHTQFLKVLLEEINCPKEEQEKMYLSLLQQNYVDYQNLVNQLAIPRKNKDYLLNVLKLKGKLSTINQCRDWFASPLWEKIFSQFSNLELLLKEYQVEDYINFDLSLVGKRDYYTGLIFYGYCEKSPYPICSGGRYDELLDNFGISAPATGFAIDIDALEKVAKEDIKAEKNKQILIIYQPSQILKAIKKAEELRQQENIVVIAPREKVSTSFADKFSKIINFENRE